MSSAGGRPSGGAVYGRLPGGARRGWLLGAGILVAALGAAIWLWPHPNSPGPPREIRLAVNETLSLDPRGKQRLRLVAIGRSAAGEPTLFFEPEGWAAGPLRVTADQPAPVPGHHIRLIGVSSDSTRGAAVQLQWLPAGGGNRPLFSVGTLPVPLPAAGNPFSVVVRGAIPPPGSPASVRLAAVDGARVLAEGAVGPEGSLAVAGLGTLRWLGTEDRLVARVRVE